MSNQAFSIDINTLPAADGLGPVDGIDSQLSSPTSGAASPQKLPPHVTGRSKGLRPNDVSPPPGTTRSVGAFAADRPIPASGSAMSQVVGAQGRRNSSPFSGTGSPGRAGLGPGSPRHLSPATSQIFERDVQESNLGPDLSPAIPSHIQTEDHIPPILDASSLLITDTHVNPDDVEIVMHATHQPAALGVATGVGMSDSQQLSSPASHADLASNPQGTDEEGGASTYGAVDPLDPRRLSFISFADVVHAEHAHAEHVHAEIASVNQPGGDHCFHRSSLAPSFSTGGVRSHSPVRTLGQHGLGNLHASATPLLLGLDGATGVPGMRRGSASIASVHATTHGDLTIETMTHALEQPLTAANTDVCGHGLGKPFR